MELLTLPVTKTMFRGLAAGLFLAASTPGHALVYSYEDLSPHGNHSAGHMDSISVEFDSITEELTWESSFSRNNGRLPNGFWLVVSDGPNPKGFVNEYAILYGDLTSNRITAYIYDGVNSSNSWRNGHSYIAGFDDAIDVVGGGDSLDISFTIDTTAINDFVPSNGHPNDWTGISFEDSVGIWFHPVILRDVRYFTPQLDDLRLIDRLLPEGRLTRFGYRRQGWYDVGNRDTVERPRETVAPVPEPELLALMLPAALGLVATARVRRGRKV